MPSSFCSSRSFRLPSLAAVALLAGGWVLPACSQSEEPMAQPHVVLLVVDTLRQDRLNPYGDPGRMVTPHLQDLVTKEGAVAFSGLLAASSWTKPSMATIWTGQTPADHGVMRLQGEHSRLQTEQTLPVAFAAAGYRTGGVMSNFLLTRRMGAGFERGFQFWDDAPGRHPDPHRGSTAQEVTNSGLGWLRQQGPAGEVPPTFLMMHYFDPHASFEDQAGVDFAPKDYAGWVAPGASTDELRQHESTLSAADRVALLAWYDEEVWEVDRAIGQVVAALKAQGMWDNTILMITADHGEELGERQHIGHTQTLMTELVDLPLLVRIPKAYQSRWRLPTSAAQGGYAMTQLMPALLSVAGIPLPSQCQLEAPAVLLTEVDFEPVRKEHVEKFVQQRAIRANGMQLTWDLRGQEQWLHDLVADPQMNSPLPADHPAWATMRPLLEKQRFWEAP